VSTDLEVGIVDGEDRVGACTTIDGSSALPARDGEGVIADTALQEAFPFPVVDQEGVVAGAAIEGGCTIPVVHGEAVGTGAAGQLEILEEGQLQLAEADSIQCQFAHGEVDVVHRNKAVL